MEIFLTVILIGMAYVSVGPRLARSGHRERGVRPRRGSRADAEAYLLQVSKEIGIEPYSPAELRQMEAEERAVAKQNRDDGEFWGDAARGMYH